MWWVAFLLALIGALYRVATVGDDASWWMLIAALFAAFMVDLNREFREWRKARELGWMPEDDDGQS